MENIRKLTIEIDKKDHEFYWLELVTQGLNPQRPFATGPLFASLWRARLCSLGWGYLDAAGHIWHQGKWMAGRKEIKAVSDVRPIRTVPFWFGNILREIQLWLAEK